MMQFFSQMQIRGGTRSTPIYELLSTRLYCIVLSLQWLLFCRPVILSKMLFEPWGTKQFQQELQLTV